MVTVQQLMNGIVGDITPHGDAYEDEQSLDNMRKFEDVCWYVVEKLENAINCKDACEASKREVASATLEAASGLLKFVKRNKDEWDE